MEAILAQDIVRRHRNDRGVDGVSVSVRAGMCLGVLGANGSGKTTLTRLVAGLDRAGTHPVRKVAELTPSGWK